MIRSYPRSLTTAALALVLSFGTLFGSTAHGQTCRTYSTTSTSFDAGSLIIPMDPKVGTNTVPGDQADHEKAIGLVWHLLKHGIRVSWVMDTSKTSVGAADFTITASSGDAVSTLARTTGSYDAFSAVSGSSSTYEGGPLVIAAADADAALLLIAQGTLPEDSSVQFGWELTTTYSSVTIHKAEVPFVAPVMFTRSSAPRRLAVADGSWMSGFLSNFGLNFTGAGGLTPSDASYTPGYVYDAMSMTDVGTYLNANDYGVYWIGSHTYASTEASSFAAMKTFVDNGGSLVGMDTGITALENSYPADCSCTGTRFMGATGVTGDANIGTFNAVLAPGHPVAQIGDISVLGMGGNFKNWTPASSYNSCVTVITEVGNGVGMGNDVITVYDDASKGTVLYIGGHMYPGASEQMNAIRRMIANVLFTGAGNTQTNNPNTTEVTRSTPIVVEHDDGGGTIQVMSFQGTFEYPPPTSNLFFNASSPTSWNYPAYAGHMRAVDLSSLSTSASPTDFDSLGSAIYWDGSSAIPAAASRTFYTASGSSTLTREDFSTSSTTAIKNTLNVGSTANADLLIGQVRAAGLGGVDKATPAYIQPGSQISFASSYVRPTVLYVPTLDGGLHAFKVKYIESPTTAYTGTDWSGDTSLVELWSFIPPNQLSLLKSNSAGLQASPAVADVYGDFLDASDGEAGQDTVKEWITMLVQPTAPQGKSIYALDVTNPDPSNTNCPSGFSTCVAGANPLWVASPTGMGRAMGAAIGVISTSGGQAPHVIVATEDDSASGTQGGINVFALDATTGSVTWRTNLPYTRTIPGQSYEPNEPPPTVAIVDKTGSTFYQTHVYVAGLDGRVWELDAEDGTVTGGAEIWDAGATTDTTAKFPITVPPALYRSASDGHLHLVVATGGIYWAPSDATTRQKLVDIDVSASSVTATTIKTFAAGERVFAAPVVSNEDIYVLSSEGLVDFIGEAAASNLSSGTAYRINISSLSSPVETSLSVKMSGSSIGISKNDKVVISTTQGSAVRAPSGRSTTSTSPEGSTAGSVTTKLALWLHDLAQ